MSQTVMTTIEKLNYLRSTGMDYATKRDSRGQVRTGWWIGKAFIGEASPEAVAIIDEAN